MSWDGAITTLEAIMTAAGTATSATTFTVWAGEPAIPPRKMYAWWYEGPDVNDLIPETLTDHPFGEALTLRAYWPVSNRNKEPSRVIETECRTLARETVARIEADRSLGENVTHVTIGDAAAGWLSADGGWWRTLTIPLVFGFTDSEPIAR